TGRVRICLRIFPWTRGAGRICTNIPASTAMNPTRCLSARMASRAEKGIMRISGAGVRNKELGVTLLELLIVMTIVALLAGLSYPSVSAGLDSMRLRSAGDQVASFLNVAMDRADRKQQVVEIRISPAENALGARSSDLSFDRKAIIPDSVRIATI